MTHERGFGIVARSAARKPQHAAAAFLLAGFIFCAYGVTGAEVAADTHTGPIKRWSLASAGGSDYGWYHLDPPCNREPYGVVYNYDVASTTIDAQLRQMYANGQRRLRIPIYFARGVNTGTVMDSTGGTLSPRFRTNLANLLAAIKASGFKEIEVSFNPQSNNNPIEWTTFSDDYFQENWSLIQNLHPIFAKSGILYHLDLLNEGIPPLSYTALIEYDQKLWNAYVAKYSRNDTLGFSIIADAAHVDQVSLVYGASSYGNHGVPPLFDVHIYDDPADSFETAFSLLMSQGYGSVPWIIGETFYNDAAEAEALRAEIRSTGQNVLYLTQWPVTAGRNCSPDVNVPAPVEFFNYRAREF